MLVAVPTYLMASDVWRDLKARWGFAGLDDTKKSAVSHDRRVV
jgi:hypothetical protein